MKATLALVVFDAANQQGQPSGQVQHFPVLAEGEALGLQAKEMLQPAAAFDGKLICREVRVLATYPFDRHP